jgi:hypothetical protein
MKIHYDQEVDAAYLQFSKETPSGVVEVSEGVNLDLVAEVNLLVDCGIAQGHDPVHPCHQSPVVPYAPGCHVLFRPHR